MNTYSLVRKVLTKFTLHVYFWLQILELLFTLNISKTYLAIRILPKIILSGSDMYSLSIVVLQIEIYEFSGLFGNAVGSFTLVGGFTSSIPNPNFRLKFLSLSHNYINNQVFWQFYYLFLFNKIILRHLNFTHLEHVRDLATQHIM